MRQFIRHPSDVPIEILTNQIQREERFPLNNVSLGGLSFGSGIYLKADTWVHIRITLVRPPFETEGRVVWCIKRNGDFDVGIQFTRPEDLFRARMVEQICHIEHYKNRVRQQEGRTLNGEEAALEWIQHYAATFPDFGPQDTP